MCRQSKCWRLLSSNPEYWSDPKCLPLYALYFSRMLALDRVSDMHTCTQFLDVVMRA